MWFQMQFE